MGKLATINAFFKRKGCDNEQASLSLEANIPLSTHDVDVNICDSRPKKSLRVEIEDGEFDINSLERDPGLRLQIWAYPPNLQDIIRRAYIKFESFQCVLSKYPKSGKATHLRSFQVSWFDMFPWLEYSPTKDAAFCLPCFVFNKPSGHATFTVHGFHNWKKVRDGKNCAFANHVGKDPNSFHKMSVKACEDLMNPTQHILRKLEKFTSQQIVDNRLRVKSSIEAIQWLTFQGCTLRGRDECKNSKNRGNFLELLQLLASHDEKIKEVVLDKAPQNASYTSSQVQKEILHVFGTRIKRAIREEIGDAKFCLIVDEAIDEAKKEQMAIVLRFVNQNGFVYERFFGLVHVSDTTTSTLKEGIFSTLSNHNLDVQNIRGQGYDGASNMRGEWNGLQALISKECPYAYYVHCFAHRLQLALVASSKEVIPIHQFFSKLSLIVNIVGASCKRHDELQVAQATELAHLLSIDELDTGRGLNQVGTLQRVGDTRWTSHLKSVSSLIKMFGATCSVLLHIIEDGTTSAQCGEADTAYEVMTSFQFVFTLHLMEDILKITDALCQALQCQSQDILNAMHLVSSTKSFMQEFRDDGWDKLLHKVKSFCELRNIDIPNLTAHYIGRKGRARHQQDKFTIEHHYHVDIFYAAIDSQLQELNNRFCKQSMELLTFSSALDPRDGGRSFRVDDICELIKKYYPEDFNDYEMSQLTIELQHYAHIQELLSFQKLSTISNLYRWLVSTRKFKIYPLVYRLITLVLTLPVSTVTTERSFSAMKVIKSRLRSKMGDEFLSDSLLLYIEKEIAEKLCIESIINDFDDLTECRVPLR